ncbi:spore germination protein [Alteribacter natronophilus]|uniref:spore germination protein n=1 Tax=Alteribacter natronophilus TaxID=2583810 RepID=UPI00110F5D11|nr:spore germination protein [Alteribacter natronophilus]TMW71018.1 spore germination protein [Alteribacter natronophilus]
MLRAALGVKGGATVELYACTIEEMKEKITAAFEKSDDFDTRSFTTRSGKKVFLAFFSDITNDDQIRDNVLTPLMEAAEITDLRDILSTPGLARPATWKELIAALSKGDVLVHADGQPPCLLPLTDYKKRPVATTEVENHIYGSHNGFVEDSLTNISLVRKLIRHENLRLKEFELGKGSRTHTALLYLEGYADPGLVEEAERRIKQYRKDHLFSVGELGMVLKDHYYALFPQTLMTERPDNAAHALSQGKVIIIADNTPYCLVIPVTMMDLLQTSEENGYTVPWNLTFPRVIRFLSMIVGAVLPALYVALVAFHPELIPTTLTLTIAQSRAQIPFPAPLEALLMMVALDVLVEASIRLPSFVGQTIGIVGGLVIGTAAVEAGIVSSTMIIVIAFTAVANFTMPNWEFSSSWRLIRYGLLLAASFLGLFGLMLALCLLMIHLCHIKSFHKPFLSPLTPLNGKELTDIFFRTKNRDKGEPS